MALGPKYLLQEGELVVSFEVRLARNFVSAKPMGYPHVYADLLDILIRQILFAYLYYKCAERAQMFAFLVGHLGYGRRQESLKNLAGKSANNNDNYSRLLPSGPVCYSMSGCPGLTFYVS